MLVHGTLENRYTTWAELAPKLERARYCVFALNYSSQVATPLRGLGEIRDSARYYLQELNGSRHVGRLVGLAPSNYGTTLFGLLSLASSLPGGDAVLGVPCRACIQ